MKIFLINLDRDTDRLKAADAQLHRLGVCYERFPAIYAKAMQSAEKNKKVNRFRWWCAMGRKIRDGEIGCACSHYAIYRKMLENHIDQVCVLEDDVVLDERFPFVLRQIDKMTPSSSPQVILLSDHAWHKGQICDDGAVGCKTPIEDCNFRLQRDWWDMFTEGYVINRRAAENLLRANFPMIVPCDMWMRWTRLGIIELYHAFPTVCTQNKSGFDSHVLPKEHLNKMRKYPHGKLLHIVSRVIGKSIDNLLIKVTGK